jgi:hypothetical protein
VRGFKSSVSDPRARRQTMGPRGTSSKRWVNTSSNGGASNGDCAMARDTAPIRTRPNRLARSSPSDSERVRRRSCRRPPSPYPPSA